MQQRHLYFGVFLTSLAVLTLELALTRLFSATMYYHFAFLAISVALFGAGASGVFIFLLQERLAKRTTGDLLSIFTILFSLSIISALAAVLGNPLATTATPDANFWNLTQIYVATALPFFFAGSAITVAISRLAHDVSRVYLYDLVGAAFGCLLLIPLLNAVGGVNAVLVIAVIAAVSGLVFSAGATKSVRMVTVIVAVLLGALLLFNLTTDRFAVRWAKGVESTNQLFSRWNSFSHITVVGDMSKPALEIVIDADASTAMTRNAGRFRNLPNPPVTIEGLVHRIKRNADVLIIGPGGGNDVLTARAYGQRSVTAVEVNRLIAEDVMQSEPFLSYSGDLYAQPDVKLVVDEGRSFIRSSREQYDIIQGTMVDTWAATAAGAFALAENNLYTVEAFKDYITHLKPDGILSMTRWYYEPPDQLLRLITISRAAMKELGIGNPARHFVIIRFSEASERVPATFLFKKSEFTDAEVAELERTASRMGMKVMYTPRTPADSRVAELITASDAEKVWSASHSNIEPTYDNNPFFFNTLRPAHLGEALTGADEWRKTNLGTYVLFSLLLISAVMVVVFIIGPLMLSRARKLAAQPGRMPFLAYFASLGLGFIVIEIAMVQKFILFLGHPVYALAVVLFAILCFCGIGSSLTRRFDDAQLARMLPRVIIAVVVVTALYVALLGPIFYGLVHLSQPLKIVIAVVLLAPLALVMGMPMPIGIRLAAKGAPEIIPWAWGLNGATSVLGSVGSLALAILTGFNQVILAGAAVYLLALLSARKFNAGSAASP